MGTISYIDGDIFEVDKSYAIGHQCNCTSNTISGLAAEVYKRYPKANIRNNTNKPELLGNIDSYQTNDGKLIINLYAQLNKGKANIAYDDCESARLQALWQALTKTKMLISL